MESVPRADADELAWLTFEQSGVLTWSQAARLAGRSTVRRRLRQGAWRAVCRNVVLTNSGRLTRSQQLWVAVSVAGDGARLGGCTAATEHGVTGLSSVPLQVVVPAERNRSSLLPQLPPDMPAVRLYRTAVLPDDHCQIGRPPRTAIARAIIDAAAWATTDQGAIAVLTAACQQRRVDPAELQRVLARFPRIRRHRLIEDTIADIGRGAHALSEVDLLALCRRHGLPLPVLQHRRTDADGRTRFVDAYWPDHQLQVEVDGAHHMDAQHWAADMLRQNQIWIAGDRILRFPAWLIRTDPAAVVSQLRAALGV